LTGVSSRSGGRQDTRSSTAKASSVKGEARAKIIAAFTEHHEYDKRGGLNWQYVKVRELQRKADLTSPTSVTRFLKDEFGYHARYRSACVRNDNLLLIVLKKLNGDLSFARQFGRTPPGEGFSAEEK
jgi:hypothetical protein